VDGGDPVERQDGADRDRQRPRVEGGAATADHPSITDAHHQWLSCN
jgi:hypothetical protein